MGQRTKKLLKRFARQLNEYATAGQLRSAKDNWGDGRHDHKSNGRATTKMRTLLAKPGQAS